MNVVTTIVKSRHSVRKFKQDSVDDKVIWDALECAAAAPTARNIQPWMFIVVRDKAILQNIADLTDNGKFIADSAVCFAIFGEKGEKYYLEDCCAATENLIIALQAYGITSCWVAGDKKAYAADVKKMLKAPEKFTLVSLVAAGLPAEVHQIPKKEMKKLVFFEKFSE